MHNSRETCTLRFILGPPIPKGNANGRIFSTFISTLSAYVPPDANKVGAQRFIIAIANLSVEPYTDVSSEGSCADEKTKVPPSYLASKATLAGSSVLFLVSGSSTKRGYGQSLGTEILLYPGCPDSWINHVITSMNN